MGKLRAVLLAIIVGATIILVPKLKSNDKHEIEISNADYVAYAAADTEPIGEIHIEPTVYDVLKDGGYNLSNNPILESALKGHSFSLDDRNSGQMTTDANFRKGPGTEYDIIEELKRDTPFKVLARSDNGWYLADYQGSLGFISADYVETYNPEALQENLNLQRFIGDISNTIGTLGQLAMSINTLKNLSRPLLKKIQKKIKKRQKKKKLYKKLLSKIGESLTRINHNINLTNILNSSINNSLNNSFRRNDNNNYQLVYNVQNSDAQDNSRRAGIASNPRISRIRLRILFF